MDEPSTAGRPERGPNEVFCRNCGVVISERAEICPECGVRQCDPPGSSLDSLVEDLTGGGNPFVAAALSAVFPGLGQLYNRELKKGLALIVASFLAALSVLVVVGLVLVPAVWLYAIYDAYRVAERQSAVTASVPEPEPPGEDPTAGETGASEGKTVTPEDQGDPDGPADGA